VFILQAGKATFTVDGQTVTARPGQVAVVPAQAPHSFRNISTGTLEIVGIHPVARMQTEWLRQT
jgi:mannose-6-phosphate isomerase-like protein (cupin superfamily)